MSTLLLVSQSSHFPSERPISSSAMAKWAFSSLQAKCFHIASIDQLNGQWVTWSFILITTCLVPNSYAGHLSHSSSPIQDSKQLEERKVSFDSQLTGWNHQGREGPSGGWGEAAGVPLLLEQEAVWSSLSEQIRGPRKGVTTLSFLLFSFLFSLGDPTVHSWGSTLPEATKGVSY